MRLVSCLKIFEVTFERRLKTNTERQSVPETEL